MEYLLSDPPGDDPVKTTHTAQYHAVVEHEAGWTVRVPAFDIARRGSSLAEAWQKAEDALDEAILSRLIEQTRIPEPARPGDECLIAPSLRAQVALLLRTARGDRTLLDLQSLLRASWDRVTSMLEGRKDLKINSLDKIARQLGGRMSITFEIPDDSK